MKIRKLHIFLFLLAAIDFGTIGYLGYRLYLLQKNKLALENELAQVKADFASTKKELEAIIASTQQELAQTNSSLSQTQTELNQTKTERDDFAKKYTDEKTRMDSFASQIEGVQSKVGTLEKLAQTDPELLKKYSKIYFLNENYIPKSFVKTDPKYTYDSTKDYLFYSEIWHFLQDMLTAAENDSINLRIISAYRSFGAQSELKSSYKMIYGSGANQFSADQGYSEHQLGTTLDFTTKEIGAGFSNFDKTTAYPWLLKNAYKFGFILSYPGDNHYYQFEPWHWRFVGRTLADKLYLEGKNFYDLDQREIDVYLIHFFD